MEKYAADQITGVIGVGDVLQGKQIRDVDEGFYMILNDNHLAPMVAITGKSNAIKKRRVAKNPKFEWTRKDLFPRWTEAVEDAAAAATSTFHVTAGEGDFMKIGDEVEIPEMVITSSTTRVLYVTGVSTDDVSFAPVGFQTDGTTALTIPAVTTGMKLHILSDASDEYSTMPAVKVVKDTQEYNFVQFLRKPYIIGNIEEEISQYTGSERVERRAETLREIKMEWEKCLIWGERGYIAGSAGRKYFTRGLKSYLDLAAGNNIFDWSGGMTESQLDEYLIEGPCKWGGQRKYWFMSTDLFLKINELAKGKERIISNRINSLGLAILEYKAPNGKILYLHQHYMFEEGYEGFGLIVDPEFIGVRPYGTQGVIKLHTEIQANDAAGVADEWRILGGFQVDRTEPHGYQYAG